MLLKGLTARTVDRWQTEIDGALEAGQAPFVPVTQADAILDGLAGVLAYQSLVADRIDVTAPLFVFGGASPLWLAALFALEPQPGDLEQPGEITYAGADPATISAEITALDPGAATGAARRLLPLPGRLDRGLQAHFLPAELPAAPVHWEALPFALAGEPAPVETPAAADIDWSAPAALFLALCLVLFALLL